MNFLIIERKGVLELAEAFSQLGDAAQKWTKYWAILAILSYIEMHLCAASQIATLLADALCSDEGILGLSRP